MDMMQTVQLTAQPALVSALLPALIIMLMINHAQLIQVSAQVSQAPLVREVSATALVKETALPTVVITLVSMVTAAAGSAVLQGKLVVLKYAGAKTECVKVPRIIALINAPPTNVMRLMVFVTISPKPTVKQIAANWPSPKGRSFLF